MASMDHIPGNPNTQQRELLAGKAFVELDKKVIEVSGIDRLTWLNDMLSQKLDELQPGESTEALWLDAQGRILRDFHLVGAADSVLLITFSQGVDELLNQLQRLVFRAQVKLELRSELKVFASLGYLSSIKRSIITSFFCFSILIFLSNISSMNLTLYLRIFTSFSNTPI